MEVGDSLHRVARSGSGERSDMGQTTEGSDQLEHFSTWLSNS